jgi:hypothetical protein
MLRDISSELVVGLKDRLRDVRHLIRVSREEARSASQDLPDVVLNTVARVMDKAFTTAESVSISLISSDPAAHSSIIEARSIDIYFPQDAGAGEALFRRDVYYLAKRLFADLGARNALLHEATFSSVHGVMLRRHSAMLWAAKRNGDLGDIAKACAVLALELQAAYQSASLPLPGHHEHQPAKDMQYLCFSAIALAIGLATYAEHELGEEKLVESAILALQARRSKLDDATGAADRVKALSDLFAFLIPHLP